MKTRTRNEGIFVYTQKISFQKKRDVKKCYVESTFGDEKNRRRKRNPSIERD